MGLDVGIDSVYIHWPWSTDVLYFVAIIVTLASDVIGILLKMYKSCPCLTIKKTS